MPFGLNLILSMHWTSVYQLHIYYKLIDNLYAQIKIRDDFGKRDSILEKQ
jgi:hypothetical protein